MKGCVRLCFAELLSVLICKVFSCSDVHEVSPSTFVSNPCFFSEPLQPQGWSPSAVCSEVPLKSIGRTEISTIRFSGVLPVKKLWQTGKKKVVLVTRIYMQIIFS